MIQPRFQPLNTVRRGLRSQFLDVLRRGLGTHDGRAIVAGSLQGLIDERSRPAAALVNEAVPYEDVATALPENATALRSDIVFVTGRFRSGSTLVWNLFRHLDDCTAYYEPFNERRWFDATLRGERVDGTHRGVADYWREYEGLDELGTWYREEWIDRRLHLDETAWMPEMQRYIERLVECAKGRPVLQFNRLDFRLPWVRTRFPAARILHVFRHPRDQWCSSLVDPSRFPSQGQVRDFGPHDHFYLLNWARDLAFQFPFLDPASVRHPYELFYLLWKLSYLFGRRYADHSVRFESLVADPGSEIGAAFEVLGIDTARAESLSALVEAPRLGRWREYADERWFRAHEERCERVLDEYLTRPLRTEVST